MPAQIRGTLQLDFDGTLAHGDVSTGILSHFAAAHWDARIEAASRELAGNPQSPALVDAMVAGFAELGGTTPEHLQYAREHHPPRPGLADLIEVAEDLGLQCHVVSNGFEFYIEDYLQKAGVHGRVAVRSGSIASEGGLVYRGPEGTPLRHCFKAAWSREFLTRYNLLVYVGDGASDVPAASLAGAVFARDSLLTGMPAGYAGAVIAFETLHDVASGLEKVVR